jgi:hypothetical protein
MRLFALLRCGKLLRNRRRASSAHAGCGSFEPARIHLLLNAIALLQFATGGGLPGYAPAGIFLSRESNARTRSGFRDAPPESKLDESAWRLASPPLVSAPAGSLLWSASTHMTDGPAIPAKPQEQTDQLRVQNVGIGRRPCTHLYILYMIWMT